MADLRSTRTSLYWRGVALNALIASLAGGKINVYTGAQVATPETGVTGTLLVTMTIGASGTISVASGVLTASTITGAAAVASGTPGWFRVTDAAGANVLFDGEVGASTDANTDNLELPAASIVTGVTVGASSLTYTLPMQGV